MGQILGLFIIVYYYNFAKTLLISERTMEASFAYKIQSSSKLKNNVNEKYKNYNNVNISRV